MHKLVRNSSDFQKAESSSNAVTILDSSTKQSKADVTGPFCTFIAFDFHLEVLIFPPLKSKLDIHF